MTHAHHQYLDGLITGLGVAAAVFGLAAGKLWLTFGVAALIFGYNVKVWGER
jgi:hypothetical protein